MARLTPTINRTPIVLGDGVERQLFYPASTLKAWAEKHGKGLRIAFHEFVREDAETLPEVVQVGLRDDSLTVEEIADLMQACDFDYYQQQLAAAIMGPDALDQLDYVREQKRALIQRKVAEAMEGAVDPELAAAMAAVPDPNLEAGTSRQTSTRRPRTHDSPPAAESSAA